VLYVAGTSERLQALTREPAVAIVGGAAASDYGIAMARSLARSLAISGVTIVAGLDEGIATAAHAGAWEARAATVAVAGGGLDCPLPCAADALRRRVAERGCVVGELPGDSPSRRWSLRASERIVIGLADAVIVVEAGEDERVLEPVRAARAAGKRVAALPGRITSALSRGPHALLLEGARLVRGAGDVLDLLYETRGARPDRPACGAALAPSSIGASSPGRRARRLHTRLTPALAQTLERVGAGADTPDQLCVGENERGEVLLALTELELLGLLARGEGGRYLPRDACGGSARYADAVPRRARTSPSGQR
jgi:DNA processing protein